MLSLISAGETEQGGVLLERIYCLGIGYLFGMLLFAELISRLRLGKSARAIGSHNPGTANITRQLGLKWGLLVLAGDLLKTGASCWLCAALFPDLGRLVFLWTGFGVTLGHNFPAWARFRGGKGVATTCAFLVLFSPLWGGACVILGGFVVLLTGYLPVAAVVITTAALLSAYLLGGPEALLLVLAADGMMALRHRHGLVRAARGKERRALRRSRTSKN